MPKSRGIALAYQEAIGKKDFQAARKLLQDNLEFRGPIDTFHKADDYLHAIQKLSAIVEGVDILKVFEDGNEVSLFCDLKTKMARRLWRNGTSSMKAKSRPCVSYSTRGLLRQCSAKGPNRNRREMSPSDVGGAFFGRAFGCEQTEYGRRCYMQAPIVSVLVREQILPTGLSSGLSEEVHESGSI